MLQFLLILSATKLKTTQTLCLIINQWSLDPLIRHMMYRYVEFTVTGADDSEEHLISDDKWYLTAYLYGSLPADVIIPPQVSRTLWAQQVEEGQRSPVWGRAEPGGVCVRAAVGVSVRGRGSVPAESAAVVVRLLHAGAGRPDRLWSGTVSRRTSRRRRAAAFTGLRSVWAVVSVWTHLCELSGSAPASESSLTS